jgi:RND family efflux transporter MFP subunit
MTIALHPRVRTLALLTLAALLTACGSEAPPPEPIRPLRVMKVGAGGTALAREFAGEVRARVDTVLAFQVGGRISERLVNVGDAVKAGQPLARIDPRDVQLAVAQAEAQRSLAAADAQRYRELRRTNFVSQALVDAKETNLAAADAQLALARNQARYTTLLADRAGVVQQVLAEPGQVVAPGQAVFRIAPAGDREVALAVPEGDYAGLRVGQHAEVSVFAMPGQSFKGVVREIAPAADAATRTYAVRVALPGQAQLPTGLSATVRLGDNKAPRQLAIPLTAVFQQGDSAAVWRLGTDDTVNLQPIRIAAWRDDVALVAEGLQGGETIAVAGVHRLHAGQKVRPVMADPARQP